MQYKLLRDIKLTTNIVDCQKNDATLMGREIGCSGIRFFDFMTLVHFTQCHHRL